MVPILLFIVPMLKNSLKLYNQIVVIILNCVLPSQVIFILTQGQLQGINKILKIVIN